MKKYHVLVLCLLLSSCVSYYEEYEQSLAEVPSGYSYYNSPLRLRGLTVNDWYMIDNHPEDYFNTQMWSGISDVSRFSIHSFFRAMAR